MADQNPRVIVAFRPCGHAEQVGGSEHVHMADVRKWLGEGLTIREMPIEEWREKHAASFLCKCEPVVAAS